MRLTSPEPGARRAPWPVALWLGLALASGAAAQGQRVEPTEPGRPTGLIPRDVLFGNPDRSAPRVSPDGCYVSYLAPVLGVLNVWVAPAHDLDAARPVTRERRRGVRSYTWAFDSQHVLYLQDTDGDENYHLYAAHVGSCRARDLTPVEGVRAEIEAVSHRHPGHVVVGLNDRDPEYHDLYRVDLRTGGRELLQKNAGFVNFALDDDYRVRFASKFTPDGGRLYLKPEGEGGWREALRVPAGDTLTTRVVGFDRAGTTAYLLDSRDRDTGALTAWDLTTGGREVLAGDPRADAGTVLLHPTENTVQAVAFNHTRAEWQFLDDGVKEDFRRLREVAAGDITVPSRTLDDRTWVVAFQPDDGPARYYLYDRGVKKARFLFKSRTDLDGWPLRKMHPVVIPARDGLPLVSYLTLPPGCDERDAGRPARPVPLVLLVHGGPWARDDWGFHPTHQFLANRGYAALSVNYRGSTGFGKKFVNAGNREWAGRMHDDLIDAVRWAVREQVAVPEKIGIMGGSYGGYATLVGLTFTPETFACGVDLVGPSDLVTLLNTIPPYWAPAVQLFKDRVGDHTTEAGKKFLRERSPLTHVDRIRRPLLIGQGANDPRVKQAESDQIVAAMRKKGIPVTYALFPDEGHGFARPENRLAFYAVAEAFLARHLGGRYQAIGTAFEGSTVTVPAGAEGVPGLADALRGRQDSPAPPPP